MAKVIIQNLKHFQQSLLAQSSPAVPSHEISDPQRAGHLFFFLLCPWKRAQHIVGTLKIFAT